MKFFWSTFSLFLLLLSVYPCGENDDCEKNIQTEITKKDNHKKQNQKSEHCTPFCICSHCPASAFCLNIPNLNLKNQTIFFQEKKLLSCHSFRHPKKIAAKIWQPPKISS